MTTPRPPKKVLRPLPAPDPRAPASFTDVEAHAIQAIIRGDASAHQQRMAMQWIITQGAIAYGQHFNENDRLEAFALGRAFVGQQLIGIARIDLIRLDNPPTKES